MSSLTKAMLASALTLPLVAFAAGVLASPDDVDPDRSRPVIIGKVEDDSGRQGPRKRAPDEVRQPDRQDPPPRDDDGPDDGPDDDADDDNDNDGRGGTPADATDDRAPNVVPPAPRDLDDDEDGGDDDNDDNTDDGGESRDD